MLDKESGKRISPEDYLASYKHHPVFGTFFKGAKGSGAGVGYGGTDANGLPVEDISGLVLRKCSNVHSVPDKLTSRNLMRIQGPSPFFHGNFGIGILLVDDTLKGRLVMRRTGKGVLGQLARC